MFENILCYIELLLWHSVYIILIIVIIDSFYAKEIEIFEKQSQIWIAAYCGKTTNEKQLMGNLTISILHVDNN